MTNGPKFKLALGVPEMKEIWERWEEGLQEETLEPDEAERAKRFADSLKDLRRDPFHPGLNSHPIDPLTRRFGETVFQSYIANHTPAAGRFFWAYGPERGWITILGVEPHPEDDKRGAYERVSLSDFPDS